MFKVGDKVQFRLPGSRVITKGVVGAGPMGAFASWPVPFWYRVAKFLQPTYAVQTANGAKLVNGKVMVKEG